MNKEERIKEVQEYTEDYFQTANLLNLTYDEVREVCENDE